MKKKNYERGGHFLDTITYKTTALSINRTSKNYSVQKLYMWTLYLKKYTLYFFVKGVLFDKYLLNTY